MSIRICVCIDVGTGDPTEAYRFVKKLMDQAVYTDNVARFDGWESSDEWYGEDGEPIDESVIQEARMKVLADEK